MNKDNKKIKKKGRKKTVLICVIGFVLILCTIIGLYFYNNMHPAEEKQMEKTMKAGFIEKKVTLNDGSIVNYAEGPEGGPALLLIHGQGGDWKDYASVLPELSKKFHIFAVDCYGHGLSSHDVSLYSWEANGKALAWFIKYVIKEKSYVSGHSSGALLTAWIAANEPDQVKGILLEDPPLFEITPEEMQEGKSCGAWKDSFTIRHNFLNQKEENNFSVYYIKNSYFMSMFGKLKYTIAQSVQDYLQKYPGQPVKIFWLPYSLTRGFYMKDYDLKFGDAFYNGTWVKGIDQENMLRNIQCPSIYLKAAIQYGKDGVLYAANSDEDAQKVQRLIAGCEMLTIKSGHDIHYEHPGFFISACDKMLNKTGQ